MKEATLIYPNQLYFPHPASNKDRVHILIEDPHFFGDPENSILFHKQKLMLHRASMKFYENEVLRKNRYLCKYVEYKDVKRLPILIEELKGLGFESIHVVDPTDKAVEDRLRKFCDSNGLRFFVYETQGFLTTKIELEEFFQNARCSEPGKFYQYQRRRLKVLVDSNGDPAGGKWMFDGEERRKVGGAVRVPALRKFRSHAYVDEAQDYVERVFPDNPGITGDFIYPICAEEAEAWFDDFLEKRLSKFAEYRKVIFRREPFSFHSMISSSLNSGLITPRYILDRTNRYLKSHGMAVERIEPFIRRIIGFREYTRALYERFEEKEKNTNFFMHSNRLSLLWYDSESGLPPLDDASKKIAYYAYCQSAERLMILGNLMLLCEVHPDEVYRFFMEMLIDAYDWAEVPNIYGLSQYAEGGLAFPVPLFYSSKDIICTSDYRDGEWCKTWDGLYWRFVDRHKMLFLRSKALAPLVKRLSDIPDDKRRELFKTAEEFIRRATR